MEANYILEMLGPSPLGCAFKVKQPYIELEYVLLGGFPLFLIARVTARGC